MITHSRRTQHKLSVLIVLLALVALGALLGRPAPAFAACGSTTVVSDETELNAALVAFNAEAGPCVFTIELDANFSLTAPPTQILNGSPTVELIVDGGGFTIDADFWEVFHMDDSTVEIKGLTIDNVFIGIYAAESDLTVTNSTFTDLDYTAINVISSVATVGNVTIDGEGFGVAGMIVDDSIMEADDILVQNTGDGISVFSQSQLYLNRATIRENEGTAVYVEDSYANIQDSTLSENYIGISTRGSELILINSTIANSMQVGIEGLYSELTITNATIARNFYGLQLVAFDGGTVTAVVHNTILAENINSDCSSDQFGSGVVNATFRNSLFGDVGDDACGLAAANPDGNGNIVGEAAKLGALGNYGGSTETIPPVVLSGGIVATSPAINTGSTALAVDENSIALPFDQRGTGFPRVVSSSVDMGAFEGGLSVVCPSFPTTVDTEAEWNSAIFCYNLIDVPATYTINFGGDIDLTASSTIINNTVQDVWLVIEGSDFTLDGQDIDDVRPIQVADDTVVTINDLTITGGNVLEEQTGGGVYNLGTLTLERVTVTANAVEEDGGGIHNGFAATMRIVDSTISLNTAGPEDEGDGGGIYNEGYLLIDGSSITGNIAISDSGVYGGGILNEGELNIIRSSVTGNGANATVDGSYGGGIHNEASLIIIDSTIAGNSATSADFDGGSTEGGGISSEIDEFYLDDLDIDGEFLIINSTISGNLAAGPTDVYGGGIYVEEGFDEDTFVTIINSTISDNSVSASESDGVFSGAGVYFYRNESAETSFVATINNSILANSINDGTPGGDCVADGIIFASNYSLYEDTDGGACGLAAANPDGNGNIVGQDPALGALLPNGGPTKTHLPTALSLAIDSGNNALALDETGNPLTADQRGFTPRIFNVTVDRGSVEVGATGPVAGYCPAEGEGVGNLLTEVLGTGQGGPTKGFRTRKLVIPNSDDVVSLYGQLAAMEAGVMKYVRFLPQGSPKIQIAAPTSPAYRTFAVDWWGSELPADANYVKGQFFWGVKGNKSPRAFVLWPTYETAESYANAWVLFDNSSENHVAWEPGFIPEQVQTIAIPSTQADGADIEVTVVLVDINKDNRPILVTVEAGGVTEQRTVMVPNMKELLNLEAFTLEDVPAGTDEVTITIESPLPGGLYPQGGDSAAMIGVAANYACESETP